MGTLCTACRQRLILVVRLDTPLSLAIQQKCSAIDNLNLILLGIRIFVLTLLTIHLLLNGESRLFSLPIALAEVGNSERPGSASPSKSICDE